MAQADLIAFIQQSMAVYDANIDTSSGSPFYLQVIQPIVNRLGTGSGRLATDVEPIRAFLGHPEASAHGFLARGAAAGVECDLATRQVAAMLNGEVFHAHSQGPRRRRQ